MSFVRPNIWKLDVSPIPSEEDPRKKKTLCVEFFLAQGAPAVNAWVETIVSPHINEDNEYVDEKTFLSDKSFYYGRQTLDKAKPTLSDIAVYQIAEAIAREAVVGKEASSLVHAVLWHWFIKGPKTRSKPLREAAPEWWELVQR